MRAIPGVVCSDVSIPYGSTVISVINLDFSIVDSEVAEDVTTDEAYKKEAPIIKMFYGKK